MALIYTYPPIGSIEDADLLLVSDVSLASNATRNMDLGTFASYVITSRDIITGTGTTDTIPVFITPTTIGDSVMTKVNGGLQIAGGLTITDFLIADGSVRLLGPTSFSANILNVNGTTNLNGNANVSGAAFIEGSLTVEGEGVFDDNVTIEGDSDLNGTLAVSGTSVLTGAVTTNAITVNGASTFNADALFEEKAEFQGAVADSQGNVGTAGQVLSSTGGGVQWVTDGGGSVTGVGTDYTIAMWNGGQPFTSNLSDSTLSLRLVDFSPGIAQPYSLQFGGDSTATGLRNSVALGYNVSASNQASLATGFGTAASGVNAASFNFETIASGNKSAAFGSGSTASGVASFAIGLGNTAATSNSFAGGLNSTANPSVNGTSAFAFGNALNVTGEDAAAFGKDNTVAGRRAFAAGANNIITSGASTFAIGTSNEISGDLSGALGLNNEVLSSLSYAIGSQNTANNLQTIALGYGLTTGAKQRQVVVGYQNAINNNANFVVGTGTAGGNKNGLEVYNDKVVLPEYGSGTVTGTAAYNLQVDAAGKIIETGTTGTDIVAGKRQAYKIAITNKTVGSPDFDNTQVCTQVVYNRQAGNNLNWSEYGNQWTPSFDPSYDAGGGFGSSSDAAFSMLEESVKDVLATTGHSATANWLFQTISYDNWMLASHEMPLGIRIDKNGASPGNGTALIKLIDESGVTSDPPNLPSTVCVWFVDTTDTSSNMGGPIPKIVFAGKDTAYAKIVNGGNQYDAGVTNTFTGNTGDTKRKYAFLIEDEYYSNMRSKYLKVTGGRVVLENLPTADPLSKGVVWNDLGTLKISAG